MISQRKAVSSWGEEANIHEDLEYFSLSSEWKEARLSMDRFDKITVDLRKYGFSFIAFVISSSSIIFDAASVQNPLPLVIVPIVVALLTLSLFLADSYYQVLLLATILHARHLENIHKEILSNYSVGQKYFGFNLTNYIEDKVQKTNAHFYTVVVYILFLIIAILMGYFSLWAYEMNGHAHGISKYLWILSSGFLAIGIFLGIISRGVSKLLREMRQTETVDNRFAIEKLFEKRVVEKAIQEVADRIYTTYKKEDFKVLTLGMGGLYFANRLIRELKEEKMTNFELISVFSNRTEQGVSITEPQKTDIEGKNILIVDDLVGRGMSLLKAIEICHSLGAASVRTCALLDAYKKRHASASRLRLDFSGLRTSETRKFFVGSGLDGGRGMSSDAAEKMRLLPYIGVLVGPGDNATESSPTPFS